MEIPETSLQIFYNLDFENKLCVDCNAPLPTYASINHGILICTSCAEKHYQLGYNISYVRSIQDKWDEYLMAFIVRGGNGRFKRFQKEYGLDKFTIDIKYTTFGCEYYRLVLKSEVEAEAPPEVINKNSAAFPCHKDIEFFPEFNNYELYTGKKFERTNRITEAYNYVKFQMEDKKVGEKLINGGGMLYNALKTTGKFVYNTSKPIAKFVGKATLKGVDCAVHYLIDDDKSKTTTKGKEVFEDFDDFPISENNNYPYYNQINQPNQNYANNIGNISNVNNQIPSMTVNPTIPQNYQMNPSLQGNLVFIPNNTQFNMNMPNNIPFNNNMPVNNMQYNMSNNIPLNNMQYNLQNNIPPNNIPPNSIPFNPQFQQNNCIINNPMQNIPNQQCPYFFNNQVCNGFEVWDLAKNKQQDQESIINVGNDSSNNSSQVKPKNNNKEEISEENDLENKEKDDLENKEKDDIVEDISDIKTKEKTKNINKPDPNKELVNKFKNTTDKQISTFYNSDKDKARTDANDFLLKP